jgi:hypothetical protein
LRVSKKRLRSSNTRKSNLRINLREIRKRVSVKIAVVAVVMMRGKKMRWLIH